jgi:hypothetical protein
MGSSEPDATSATNNISYLALNTIKKCFIDSSMLARINSQQLVNTYIHYIFDNASSTIHGIKISCYHGAVL